MKLLESTRFEAINSALSIKTGDSKILGRYVGLVINYNHIRYKLENEKP